MATKKTFKFSLGDDVTIKVSGEKGEIRSRLHSLDTNPQYLVHCKGADGSVFSAWFYEDQLAGEGPATEAEE